MNKLKLTTFLTLSLLGCSTVSASDLKFKQDFVFKGEYSLRDGLLDQPLFLYQNIHSGNCYSVAKTYGGKKIISKIECEDFGIKITKESSYEHYQELKRKFEGK